MSRLQIGTLLLGFSIGLALFSCQKESADYYEPKIVVEGFIERDSVAVVYLSQNVNPNLSIEQIKDIPIVWGKVTVVDELTAEREILVGQRDTIYLGYKYKGYTIKGRAGGSYRIEVEYSGRVIQGSTTIPLSNPEFGPIHITQSADSLCSITASITNPQSDCYYLFRQRSKQANSHILLPTLLGVYSGSIISSNEPISIYRLAYILDATAYTPLFAITDDITIELSTIDKRSFDFWTSFQNEIINYTNSLYPSNISLATNLSGGLGIWCGYNHTQKRINIADSIKFKNTGLIDKK